MKTFKYKIKKLYKIDENSTADYILTKQLYKNKEEISDAIELGKECTDKFPDCEFFWKFLGYAYNLNEGYDRALECTFRRVTLNPNNIYNWMDIAFAYRSNGDITISDWMLFNLEPFMFYYKKLNVKELNHGIILMILNKIKAKCN